jgi:hypothetical protein
MGDPGLKQFVYSMSADCKAATVTLSVMNGSLIPISHANTFLKYVDFSTGLISNVETDQDGIALHKLPGNVVLMRGLFILVIEKYGYRNKEIHFDISPCFTNSTGVKPPKPVPPKNQTPPTNQTPQQNQTPALPNQTANGTSTQNGSIRPSQNSTANGSAGNSTNQSATQNQDSQGTPSICPITMVIAAMAVIGGILILSGRKRRWKGYRGKMDGQPKAGADDDASASL